MYFTWHVCTRVNLNDLFDRSHMVLQLVISRAIEDYKLLRGSTSVGGSVLSVAGDKFQQIVFIVNRTHRAGKRSRPFNTRPLS